MKLRTALLMIALSISLGAKAHATNNYQICSNSGGTVSVENGNVDIKGGIGDVGPATTQEILQTISETYETCVDGPNYISTIVTVESVTYGIEEDVDGSALVLCTRTITGTVSPTECK